MSYVVAAVADLFFADRLQNGLSGLGHRGQVVDLSMETLGTIPAEAELVVVDLEAGEPALQIIAAARAQGVPVLAFGPHKDLALREAGLRAGAGKWVAKSTLVASFATLIADMVKH